MRPVTTWMGLLLILCVGGLAVAQALPPEILADQDLLEGTRVVAEAQPAAPESPGGEAAPASAETDTADEEQDDPVSYGDWVLGLGSAVLVMIELLF